MAPLKLVSLLGLAATAVAYKCQNLTVELPNLEARNGVFDLEAPQTDMDVTNFMLEMGKQGAHYADDILLDYATVSGTYEIAATYCEPDNGPSDVLQILTHGVAFDKSYWDFPANNYNYSYTKVAVDDYGYSTFAYDRLGLGGSSRADPISELQSWLELAVLQRLTHLLRASEVPGLEDKDFSKLVHVGHSFGAILSYSLTVNDPCASDGIVLTGFSQHDDFVPYFLYGGNFINAANSLPALSDYAYGYIATATENAAQTNFFGPDNFDLDIFKQVVASAQPGTLGEFLTLPAKSGEPSEFGGPSLVITGDRDVPFCGGDCSNTGDPELESFLDVSAGLLTKAKPFESYVVAGAGHALTFEYSHLETTGKILDFLVQNGLAAN